MAAGSESGAAATGSAFVGNQFGVVTTQSAVNYQQRLGGLPAGSDNASSVP